MKTVFIVQGYKEKVGDELRDIVVVEVFAKSEKEAIKKASNYIKKDNYRVSNIIEK